MELQGRIKRDLCFIPLPVLQSGQIPIIHLISSHFHLSNSDIGQIEVGRKALEGIDSCIGHHHFQIKIPLRATNILPVTALNTSFVHSKSSTNRFYPIRSKLYDGHKRWIMFLALCWMLPWLPSKAKSDCSIRGWLGYLVSCIQIESPQLTSSSNGTGLGPIPQLLYKYLSLGQFDFEFFIVQANVSFFTHHIHLHSPRWLSTFITSLIEAYQHLFKPNAHFFHLTKNFQTLLPSKSSILRFYHQKCLSPRSPLWLVPLLYLVLLLTDVSKVSLLMVFGK